MRTRKRLSGNPDRCLEDELIEIDRQIGRDRERNVKCPKYNRRFPPQPAGTPVKPK